MATALPRIESLGATALGIGPAAAYQARHLMASGHPFPLLMDPDREAAKRIGVQRRSLAGFLFNLVGWMRYLRRFLRIRRQGRLTGHYSYLPAVAVTDAGGHITWSYLGKSLADYPKVDTVLAQVAEQRGDARR